MHRRSTPRRGALAVEAAVVYPVLLMVVLWLIVGGMGVFRHQQVACLAREAARWASVRGGDWQKETDKDSPTQDQIRDQALAFATGMEPTKINLDVQWINRATGEIIAWDKASKSPRSLTKTGAPVTNAVRVTVTYQWSPDVLIGPLTLTSTCEVPMTF